MTHNMKISGFRWKQIGSAAVTAQKFNRRRPALLGRPNVGGGYTVTVPGGQGYVFVRVLQGAGSSVAMALDRASMGTTGDTPIYVDYDADQRLIITGLRYEGS